MEEPKVPEEKTSEPTPSLPVKPTVDFLTRTQIEMELRPMLREEYEHMYQIWKSKDFAELGQKNEQIINEGLKKYFEEWKQQQTPPTPEDLQKLLDQDYETFTVPLNWENEEGKEESVTFTLRELPQSTEKKFYKQFKERLLPNLQMLEAITQAGMDKPFDEKAKAVLALFDESFDILADAVVLCLNAYGRKAYINRQWVQDHIGSDRQWRIVEAQMKVNRLRDFFSKVSTSGQNMMTMRRPNFQALQELSR